MADEILFPSQAWVDEYCKKLSESPDYNKAGKGWKDPIMFTISDPDSLSERPEFNSFTLYLKDGRCEKCEMVRDENSSAPFVLTATYANWKKIIDGKINPTQAMLTGQLKVKGNMALILRYASAAIAMVKVAQMIPTRYIS
ncbi:SCP2 sterol-binding domain-containing protein [Thermoplasma sp.]|uniref:SCP2 sterol-binding domain-containing protein n=1 Tax=Thermoplasma sp. TaxID=1973142 RepID=UPI001276CF40|nr:SCP2 sterol-binding domain-containing protein [Thermoplasma sp.]KAA8923083.1 MAG: Fis family transcriptional regulator [Thermoplasma sp.]